MAAPDPYDFPELVADRIRARCHDRGWRLVDLRDELAGIGYLVSVAAVGHWTTGRCQPPLEALAALSIVFGVRKPGGWLPGWPE